MKKAHIILIVLIAAVAAILISTYTSAVDSVTFAQAKTQAGKQVKVVGSFDKTNPIVYDAVADPNLTRFHVIDSEGASVEVFLHDKQGQPMGLAQSENVTLEGKYEADGSFHATHLLMKCPSKYNEQKHSLAAEN
jgi:cytochrome c-type biogenesis protein CcmE